jgi:protoporphyrinogen IX oxidase
MYFWLKFLHISAVALWFVGLIFLPRLFLSHAVGERTDTARLASLARTVYFGFMTPAAAIAIALGLVLIALDFHGAWLAVKLALVAAAVLLHAYGAVLLRDLARGHVRHAPAVYRAMGWAPLLLVLAIAALSGAKPEQPWP